MNSGAQPDSVVIAHWYIVVANCCVDRFADTPSGGYLDRALRACTVVRCVLLQSHLTEDDRAQIERDLSDIKKRIEAVSASSSVEPPSIV